MIWLLATVALADDAARLLGPAPAEVAPAVAAPAVSVGFDITGLWPLGLAGVGAGLLWFARRRRSPQASFEDSLVVLGRTPLGGSSALVLVDVAQPGGAKRRLVVAIGSGTPTLLADLGDDSPAIEEEEEAEDAGMSGAPSRLLANPYAAQAPPPRPDRKAAALALIDEVVGTRRTGRS